MKRQEQGFTLLEIMLVVTIIALLMGAAIYKMTGSVEYSKHVKIAADIQGINTQLRLYESTNGFSPRPEQGLQAQWVHPETEPKPSRWYHLYSHKPKDPCQNDSVYPYPVS